jgi:hypothetical protein
MDEVLMDLGLRGVPPAAGDLRLAEDGDEADEVIPGSGTKNDAVARQDHSRTVPTELEELAANVTTGHSLSVDPERDDPEKNL